MGFEEGNEVGLVGVHVGSTDGRIEGLDDGTGVGSIDGADVGLVGIHVGSIEG